MSGEEVVMEYGSFIWKGRCPQCNMPWESEKENIQCVVCSYCHTMFDHRAYGKQEEVKRGEFKTVVDPAVPAKSRIAQWKRPILQALAHALLIIVGVAAFWWIWYKLCLCSGGWGGG